MDLLQAWKAPGKEGTSGKWEDTTLRRQEWKSVNAGLVTYYQRNPLLTKDHLAKPGGRVLESCYATLGISTGSPVSMGLREGFSC